jgi:hypothetical protein
MSTQWLPVACLYFVSKPGHEVAPAVVDEKLLQERRDITRSGADPKSAVRRLLARQDVVPGCQPAASTRVNGSIPGGGLRWRVRHLQAPDILALASWQRLIGGLRSSCSTD